MNNFDQPLSVSEVNNYLRDLTALDPILNNLWVEGEISNLKAYQQQYYFCLKDEQAQINCVIFETYLKKMKFQLEEGLKVNVKAKLSIFNKRGTYNLVIFHVEPAGIGTQLLKLQQLITKLKNEGLLDRKRDLPVMPHKVAVITSANGAAIKDIIKTIGQRFPLVKLILVPAIVQGKNAVQSIITGLKLCQKIEGLELIILSRGGGSKEDLAAFNDEHLARQIFKSKLPVVSAVGHEIDISLSDLVSDLYAPTPSAVAEMIFPDIEELKNNLGNQVFLLNKNVQHTLEKYQRSLDFNSERLYSRLLSFNKQLKSKIDNLIHKLINGLTFSLEQHANFLKKANSQLALLNPLSTLTRGYSITYQNQQILKTINGLKNNDIITTSLIDGQITSKVIRIDKKTIYKGKYEK